jgi:hypothetical protein
MRFLFAKHRIDCKYCHSEILRGELYVQTFFRKEALKLVFRYHFDCYLTDYAERIRKSALYWQNKMNPPKKMGRPIRSTSPVYYRKLKALYRYHMNKGNIDRANEVQYEINRIAFPQFRSKVLPIKKEPIPVVINKLSTQILEDGLNNIKEQVNADTDISGATNSLAIGSGVPEGQDSVINAVDKSDEATGTVWPETNCR